MSDFHWGLDPANLRRSMLRAVLLLLIADKPRHGYELADEVRENPLVDATVSYVYRTLRSLKSEGVVTSAWHDTQATGQTRRVYQLSAIGQAELDELAGRLGMLTAHLQDFARQYSRLRTRPPEPPARPA